MGKKGRDPPGLQRSIGSDVIYAERRGQSQKPEEIYQLIEDLVPGGGRPILLAFAAWTSHADHYDLLFCSVCSVFIFASVLTPFRYTISVKTMP